MMLYILYGHVYIHIYIYMYLFYFMNSWHIFKENISLRANIAPAFFPLNMLFKLLIANKNESEGQDKT